jgi:AraC family transcriptional regulator
MSGRISMGDRQGAYPNQSAFGDSFMLPPLFSVMSDEWILEHHRQPAYELPPQSFLMYSISVMLDGPSNIEVKLGGKTYRQSCTLGDVSIAPYRFSMEGALADPCEFIQVHLRPSFVERVAGDANTERVEIVPCLGVLDPLAAQTVNGLLDELTGGASDPAYVDALVKTLAAHLIRYYSATAQNEGCRVGGLPNYLLRRVQDYINSSLDRRLSRADVARALGVDPSRLAHAFRATTGKGLFQYVDECRVEKAKLLLTENRLSIEEVGRRVGINNTGRFATIFQKLIGVSPEAFRQKSQT